LSGVALGLLVATLANVSAMPWARTPETVACAGAYAAVSALGLAMALRGRLSVRDATGEWKRARIHLVRGDRR
jgi:hypothetical protein